MLASVAARLSQLDESSVICERLHEGHFGVVIAARLEQGDSELTVSNFLYVVGRAIASDGRSLHLTVSGGVSVFPVDGVTADLLLQRAESALEETRRRSRSGGHLQIYAPERSEEHTSELQSLMRISYAVFCLQKKKSS